MKRLLGSVALAALVLGACDAFADLEISGSIEIHSKADFDAPLASYGTWVDVGPYGRCWHPARVEADWRPYCSGYWEYTDCGWYWESDEPWAWACYHYGSWVDDPQTGWVWVPDVEWAPAWVSWREGAGYIGWAPLPPRHLGISIGIAAAPFVFVEAGHFHEHHRPSTVIVNNTTIINRTTVINNSVRQETRNFDGGSRRVNVNVGPPVADIQKSTGHQFRPVAIREAVTHTPAPKLERQPANQPHPAAVTPAQPNPRSFRDQPRSDTEREPTRVPAPEKPAPPSVPERDKQPPNHEVTPPTIPPAGPTPRTEERPRTVAPPTPTPRTEERPPQQPSRTVVPETPAPKTEERPAQPPPRPVVPETPAPRTERPQEQPRPTPETRPAPPPPREQLPPQHEVAPAPNAPAPHPAPPPKEQPRDRRRNDQGGGQ